MNLSMIKHSVSFCSKDHGTPLQHKCTPEIEMKKDQPKDLKLKSSDYILCNCCSTTVSILESVTCVQCKKRFCLLHRHKADHICQSLIEPNMSDDSELLKRKIIIENILKRLDTESISKGVILKKRNKNKNDPLAKRVAAMKLKSISVGQQSIPLEERLYFYVSFVPNEWSFDQELKKFNEKPIYLCKEWSIGKCVDWIATNFDLKNRNNEYLQPKLVITTEELLRQDSVCSNKMENYCCDSKHIYFCFSHELRQLESLKVISNTDKLLVTYFQI